jgi:endonuclease YncB( thermonuclease family)
LSAPILPVVFGAGLAIGVLLPVRSWVHRPAEDLPMQDAAAVPEAAAPWIRAGNPEVRHAIDVVRVIDGDTFEARVHLWPGLDMTTRVRLRGIDAAELNARCPEELRLAETAREALRAHLDEGGVTITDIGPDKYNGRVVANAATRRTPDISAAMLESGDARRYHGGHREGWCGRASR